MARIELNMSWCRGWDVSGVMRWPLNHAGVVGVLYTRSWLLVIFVEGGGSVGWVVLVEEAGKAGNCDSAICGVGSGKGAIG